jgi:hypothetical protein
MEPLDFQVFVLPLALLIGILVLMVFYYARKEERQERKLKKLMRRYVTNRLTQKEVFAKELGKLQVLLQNKSIDEYTYNRLKETLEISFAQKREEARTQFEHASKDDRNILHG